VGVGVSGKEEVEEEHGACVCEWDAVGEGEEERIEERVSRFLSPVK
jgi:hypothetical protein